MPTDRLFRYSISGTMFILSLLFFIFFFGIHQDELESLIFEKNFVMLIGLFLSTPVIGLIVSTFAFLTDYARRRKVYYYVPNDPLIIDYIFDQFPDLEKPKYKKQKSKASDDKNAEVKKYESKNPEDWTNGYIDTFYPYYQLQVRKFITGQPMEYLERRWSVYWTNTNTIAGVFVAFLVVVILTFFSKVPLEIDRNPFKIIGVSVLGGYCVLAYIFRMRDMKQGQSFERLTLHKEIEEKKRNQYKESTK